MVKSLKLHGYPLPASVRTPTVLTEIFRGSPQSFRENVIESLIRPQVLNAISFANSILIILPLYAKYSPLRDSEREV